MEKKKVGGETIREEANESKALEGSGNA